MQPVQGPSDPVLRAQHVVLLDPQKGEGGRGVTSRARFHNSHLKLGVFLGDLNVRCVVFLTKSLLIAHSSFGFKVQPRHVQRRIHILTRAALTSRRLGAVDALSRVCAFRGTST